MVKNEIDGLFFIPPVKPVPRPFDLGYTYFEKFKDAQQHSFISVQAGPLSIINILEEEGYSLKFFDFNQFKCKETLESTIESLIKKFNPKIVLAYSYTAYIPGLKKAFDLFKIKNPNIYTIVGGQHVTFLDIDTLQDFNNSLDFIVRGEGEKTIVELCNELFNSKKFENIKGITYKIHGKIRKNQDRKLMNEIELKNLPNLSLKSYPREELKKPLYFSINLSRGCPYYCTFCSNPRFWNRQLRFRSIDTIIEDINYLNEKYRVFFEFGDSNLPINKKIFREFVEKFQKEVKIRSSFGMILIRANLVENERMNLIKKFIKDHPLAYITIGLENTHPKILALMNKPSWNIQHTALKKIKHFGMKSIPSWMVGFPGENAKTMAYNLSMLDKLNKINLIDSTILFIYTPLPGTPPFHETKKFGIEIHHYNWEYYDRAIFPPPYSLRSLESNEIVLTSEEIWNYWLLMVEIQKKWKKIRDLDLKKAVELKDFLKFMKSHPSYENINPVEGKINLFLDFN